MKRGADLMPRPVCHFVLRLLRYMHGMLEPEGDERFRRQEDLPVAGERISCGSRTCSGQRSNQSTFAAASQAADQSSKRAATACEDRRAPTLTLFHLSHGAGGYRIATPAGMHPLQTQRELCAPLEAPERSGSNHRAFGARTAWDHNLAIDHNIIRYRSGEGVARLTDFGTEILIEPHSQPNSSRNGNARRRRRNLLLLWLLLLFLRSSRGWC